MSRDFHTISTTELPNVPRVPEKAQHSHTYPLTLFAYPLMFVLSQSPEQQANDIPVYKNKDRIVFGKERVQVTLTLDYTSEPMTFTVDEQQITIPPGWCGQITLGHTTIYPVFPHVQHHLTPEEAVAKLIQVLHDEEWVRTLYQEAVGKKY